jgi:hypothetical protein
MSTFHHVDQRPAGSAGRDRTPFIARAVCRRYRKPFSVLLGRSDLNRRRAARGAILGIVSCIGPCTALSLALAARLV